MPMAPDPKPGPDRETLARVTALVGRPVLGFRVPAGGHTVARRWVLQLEGGGTVFVKRAVEDHTDRWLAREARVYQAAEGCPALPRMLGWDPRPGASLLVLEDLGNGRSPPPWTRDRLEALEVGLAALAAVDPGRLSGLPTPSTPPGWEIVAADIRPFLALGMASESWLRANIQTLYRAEKRLDLGGGALVHRDLRSDNLVFLAGRCRIFDWEHGSRGDPRFDRVLMAPALALEGGPTPDEWVAGLPRQGLPEMVAYLAGFLAARAGLPEPGLAPGSRAIQKAQLGVALPWACRVLGIPEPVNPGRGPRP